MSNKYDSRIEKAKNITTSNGGSYITPFDFIRSRRGRELIDSFASSDRDQRETTNTPAIKQERKLVLKKS